jgi:hypothetical protein
MNLYATKHNLRRFGGQRVLAADSVPIKDDLLGAFLGCVSERFSKEEASFPPYKVPERGSVKMKDDIAAWVGRIWMHQNPFPTGPTLAAFNILSLEDEYLNWLDRHGPELFEYGLAVEEIWVCQQMHDQTEYTVVTCDRFVEELTPRIQNKLILDAPTLVWLLAALCVKFDVSSGFNALVAHGEISHTIQLRGLNSIEFDHPHGDVVIAEGWFTFHDPWPARSLLTRTCADVPITVLENIAMPPYWLISPQDFSRVIVGFLFPTHHFEAINNLLKELRQAPSHPTDEPWFELTESDELFPVLRAQGAPLDTLFPSQVGLARIALMNHDAEGASSLLEEAYDLRPTEASRSLFTSLLTEFERPELARAWQSSADPADS